jgi:hypothetical protein
MPLCYQRYLLSVTTFTTHMGCPASIRPFWISREPVAWPWCNMAAGHRRPYCASMNSHSPMGLVSRQWDAIDWACVLCDRHVHNDRASRCFITTMRLPILQLSFRLLWQSITSPRSVSPLQPRFGSLLGFPKAKILIEREVICECDGHTVHKLGQQRLTADWLAPWDSDCSWTHSKVSSDRLPCYIKATRPVLEIFKMDGYVPDSPRICHLLLCDKYLLIDKLNEVSNPLCQAS